MAVANPARIVEGVQLPASGTWRIDPAHSHVEFSVRHMMVGRTRGRFGSFDATAEIGDAPERSSVEVTIDAASIDTRDEGRDTHLRSADFLDAERFPHLTFRSTGVERAKDRWRVAGELTIRDVTRPVSLDVELHGVTVDPWGSPRAFFTASAEIDREEFGLRWNQVLETGGVLVGRTVRLDLEVQLVEA